MRRVELPNGFKVAGFNDLEPAVLYHEMFVERSYLRNGVALSPGDVVFDVGANIGMAALFFYAECPAISVHAFEPGSRTFAALRENMAEFKVPVTLHNAA